MLYNERRRASGSDILPGEDSGVMNLQEYMVSRKEGLKKWEDREGELLEKLKYTVTKQS